MKFRFILMVAAVAALNTVAALAAGAEPAAIVKADLPGIDNFSQIEGTSGFGGARVGFGGATDPSAMSSLENAGFAAVISLRFATEAGVDVDASRAAAEAMGLNYIHLPFTPENPDPAVITDFLASVGNPANQPVYIHCSSATRVAALWMIGRVLVDGWEIDQARVEAEAIARKPDEAVAFATAYIKAQRE